MIIMARTRFLVGFAILFLMHDYVGAQQTLVVGKDWTIVLGETDEKTETVTITEAIAHDWVEAEFRVGSGLKGLNLSVSLKNLSHKPLRLRMAAGSVLYPKTEVSPENLLRNTFRSFSGEKNEKSLPTEGGTVNDIEVFCIQYFLPTPGTGTLYFPVSVNAGSRLSESRHDPSADISLETIKALFPPGWLNEEELRKAETRIQALVLWAESGIQAASTPFDMFLLSEVRRRLRVLGVSDPYETALKTAPQKPAEYIAQVSAFAGREPHDFAALRASFASKNTSVFDIDDWLVIHSVAPADQGPVCQEEWLVQTVPEKMLKQAQTFMRNYLPGTPLPRSMEHLEAEVKSADATLDEVLSSLPAGLAKALRMEKENLLKQFGERSSQALSRACTQNLLDGSEPAGLVDAWRLLPPMVRVQLANFLQVVAESNTEDSSQDAIIHRMVNAAPAGLAPFLKEWNATIKSSKATLSETVDVLRTLTVFPDMLPQSLRQIWTESVISEEAALVLENAFLARAEAAELFAQNQKVLDSGLMQDVKAIGQRVADSIADTNREGKKELVGVNPLRTLGIALAEHRDKPLEQLPDQIPGKRVAVVVHRLISHMRRMSGTSSHVLYRMTEELQDLNLCFWNAWFEALKLPGFETHKDFIATRRHNLADALESVEKRPSTEEMTVLVLTIPTHLTEEEFAAPASDFIDAIKNNNPNLTATGYNKFIGAPLQEEVDQILRSHPDVKIFRSYAELKSLLESDDVLSDCTLNLTIVAHEISGPDYIEFPDRPEGVEAEFVDLLNGYLRGGQRSLETNMIVCWAGAKHAIKLLKIPHTRPITAPQGEIRPQTGIVLLRRALDLKQQGMPFWKAHTQALRKLIDDIIGIWKNGKPPPHVLIDSVDSFPSPEAKNQNPDMAVHPVLKKLPIG